MSNLKNCIMNKKTVEITEVSVDELADMVADKLLDKIKHYIDDLNSNEEDVYLTRHEAAEFLSISLVTLWSWSNKGKVNTYCLGSKKYYNKKELIDLLRHNRLKSY